MERNENTPLLPSNSQANQDSVRQNLQTTMQNVIYTSYLLMTLRILVVLAKIIPSVFILTVEETDSGAPLKWWVLASFGLDLIYLVCILIRIPYIKRIRAGQEIQQAWVLQAVFRIQTVLYIFWMLPGNLWYWRCGDCYDNAPALTGLTFSLLLLGYLYLLVPVLLLITICACLPVSIVFLMMVSNLPNNPATENMLKDLEIQAYQEEKHGNQPCAICTSEYEEGEPIVVMMCDSRHFFHEECIKKWLRINANCPICRAPFIIS